VTTRRFPGATYLSAIELFSIGMHVHRPETAASFQVAPLDGLVGCA